ncbi:MAG: 50S ribosomal protein L29 [Bacteroidetes bacterium]|nr:50S ribosomal protein L29 [Bacteroidota bacterium]
MKAKEIKAFTDKELKEKLAEEKLSLTKLGLSHAISPLENPMRINHTRKAIARLFTESRKRKIAASSAQ